MDQAGKETFVTLCRGHGADYLAWFEQVSCMWQGCIKRGAAWDNNGVTQRWCPMRLQNLLFRQDDQPPPAITTTPQEVIVPSLTTSVSEISMTPSQSERAVSSDQQRLVTLDEYRKENEEWRTAFAADIQRMMTDHLQPVEKKGISSAAQAKPSVDSGSETGKSRTSVDEQVGYPPGLDEAGPGKEGRSSGSASWSELERAWNLDSETGEEERNLEKLWAKHCNERKKKEKVEERRASCPELGSSFKAPEIPSGRKTNPMEEVLLCDSTSGVGIRNQEWLPRFPQKPQTKGTDVPIMIIQDCPPPEKGVNEWATVTDALTNVLFDGMTDRGGRKGFGNKEAVI